MLERLRKMIGGGATPPPDTAASAAKSAPVAHHAALPVVTPDLVAWTREHGIFLGPMVERVVVDKFAPRLVI